MPVRRTPGYPADPVSGRGRPSTSAPSAPIRFRWTSQAQVAEVAVLGDRDAARGPSVRERRAVATYTAFAASAPRPFHWTFLLRVAPAPINPYAGRGDRRRFQGGDRPHTRLKNREKEVFPFLTRTALLGAVLAAPAASHGQQTCPTRDLAYRLDGDDLVWSEVRAVSANDSLLVVLTGSDPVIHLFELSDGSLRGSWGRSGEGPGEFQSRTDVALVGGHVYALDGNQRRLSIFDITGDLVRSVGLQDFGLLDYRPRRLDRADGGGVLLGLSVPMGNERIIIARSFGASASEDPARQDTVIVYPARTATLRLTAEGSPSYTASPPYAPSSEWTPVSGGVAFWDGSDSGVSILGYDGEQRSVVSLALDDRFEVTAEDREYWLQNEIPQEFMGQRVFEPLRREARRTVDFPRYHPLLFDLQRGTDDLLWVRRTPDGRDEVWDIVDAQGQAAGRVALGAGQALMAVIPDYLILKATDALGVESVELHRCRSF